MRNKLGLLSFLLFSVVLYAADSQPEVEIDRNLVDKIYRESIRDTVVLESETGHNAQLIALATFFTPTTLTLTNPYFQVPYADSVGGLPALIFGASQQLFSLGSVNVFGEAQAGYGYKESLFTINTASKTQTLRDLIRLHYIPIRLALLARVPIGISWVAPQIRLGLGTTWFYQAGKLDGLEQGFWVPLARVAPSLRFFEGNAFDWFGGIDVGASFETSLFGEQTVKGMGIEIGALFRI